MNNTKLAIIVLGNPNSGKSQTWYELFNRKIRTGWKVLNVNNLKLEVFVKNSSFEETKKHIGVKVFVRNASFEEYGDSIENSAELQKLPQIIFCSVQYNKKGLKTIEWFKKNNYYLYIQWLNPGYKDKDEYKDTFDFEKEFKNFGEFHKVSGKETSFRSNEIKSFLVQWVLAK